MKLNLGLIWTLMLHFLLSMSKLNAAESLNKGGYQNLQHGGTIDEDQAENVIRREKRYSTKVKAVGPGLEKTGVVATKKTFFEVFTKGSGSGNLAVTIMDPSGGTDTVLPTIRTVPGNDGVYLVEYTPVHSGIHSITVKFGGEQSSGSPYRVNVNPKF